MKTEPEELERQQQIDTQHAKELLCSLEGALKTGCWKQSVVPDILNLVSFNDRATVLPDVRNRLHLVAGLYAFLVNNPTQARAEFITAKQLGADNPKTVVPSAWTLKAVEAFAIASANN